jgi:FkbM family methyltransferase
MQVTGVIHVGAHRGEEFEEHKALGAKKIIWIEANPDVYMELIQNLEDSEVLNIPYQFACSDVDDQTVDFNVIYGPDAGFMVGNKGCSSLLSPVGRFKDWHKDTIQVKTKTLDSLFDQSMHKHDDYQLLEMDVQGAELMVLRGAQRVLKSIKYISTEVTLYNPDYADNPTFGEINTFLEKQGFVHVENKFYGSVSNWGDALFVRKELV